MSEFDLPLSPRWVRSVESEAIAELTDLGVNASDELFETWFADSIEPHLQPFTDVSYDGDEWEMVAEEILRRPYYTDAPIEERRRIEKALIGPAQWVYTKELLTDGLWDEVAATRVAPVTTMSRFVLSGALGDALRQVDPQLTKQAEQFIDGSLNQAVLIGGAAVYMYQQLYFRDDLQGTYEADDLVGQLRWRTNVGGDLHGDFRTERFARPIPSITDTAHHTLAHHFMPAVYESRTGAYHSTEIGIVSGLLYHLVTQTGRDRESLHTSLRSRLEGKRLNVGGAFGDYGSKDGDIDARMLRDRLADTERDDVAYTAGFVVGPGLKSQFRLDSQPGGIRFAVTEGANIIEHMHIPDHEIEQYIATMIIEGGGRTAPGALLRVIDALIDVRE